ncbi:PilZ domain-containing protein [Ahniella affigens]|nr:PilZ domain-containing protein [Ahniella affigens]
MAEFFDDRRQEPRFDTVGEGEVEINGQRVRGSLIDLSINGLKMQKPIGFGAPDGSRFKMNLVLPEQAPFAAEVMLVRTNPDTIGVEFMDMPPRDFACLTQLIERFQTLRAHAMMQVADTEAPAAEPSP